MKLTVNQNEGFEEPEVILNCRNIDGRISGLIDMIRQYTQTLEGELDGAVYQVPLEKVIYIESVEKRTFFYDRFRIFASAKTLTAMEKELEHANFLRISKNCVANLALIDRVIPYGDRKARIVMTSGECLEVGRSYRNALLVRLRQSGISTEKKDVKIGAEGKIRMDDEKERAVRNAGKVLAFQNVPQRVIALSYGAAELLCALGAEDALIAIAPAEEIPEHITERYRKILGCVPVLNNRGDGVPDLEELCALTPDLVIGSWYYLRMMEEGLRKPGNASLFIWESTLPKKAGIEQLYQDILNLGKIFRAEDRAVALVEKSRKKMAALTRQLEKCRQVRVFVYDSKQFEPVTTGKGTLEHDLIKAAGGRNVFGHLEEAYRSVSWGAVAQAQPEVFVIHDYPDSMTLQEKMDYLQNRPELKTVPAVLHRRFVALALSEIFPGIQCAAAVEKMIRAFHPDVI